MILKGKFVCLFGQLVLVSPYITFLAYNATNGPVAVGSPMLFHIFWGGENTGQKL